MENKVEALNTSLVKDLILASFLFTVGHPSRILSTVGHWVLLIHLENSQNFHFTCNNFILTEMCLHNVNFIYKIHFFMTFEWT